MAAFFRSSSRASWTRVNKGGVAAEDVRRAASLAEAGRAAELREMLQATPGAADAGDEHAFTPLMHACTEGHSEVVRLLLVDFDVNVNARNCMSETALHMAAAVGSEPVVVLLLAHGADASLRAGPEQLTPAALAERLGHGAVLQLLPRVEEPAACRERELSSPTDGISPRELAYSLLDADLASLDADERAELSTVLTMVLENLQEADRAGGSEPGGESEAPDRRDQQPEEELARGGPSRGSASPRGARARGSEGHGPNGACADGVLGEPEKGETGQGQGVGRG